MKKILLSLLILLFSVPAMSATLKIATIAPEGSQWMKDMRASAKEIRQRTEGRINVKYYGGGVMGNDKKVLSRIRIGSLQGGALTPVALASQYADLNLYGLPLVFDSEEEAQFVRERMDKKLQQGLADAGYVSFGFAAGGFAIMMSNSPIKSLADLRGKKIWVPEGDTVSYQSMEALSLSPVTLPLTDVLTGLQTGLIDIVAMSPIGALVLQWHTKIKYITELPLVYTLGFMAIDKRAFDKLNPNDQSIVKEVMAKTYEKFDDSNLADNKGARDALIKAGIKSVAFDTAEFKEIRRILSSSSITIGENGGFSMELYDEMLRHVSDFRNEQVSASGPRN